MSKSFLLLSPPYISLFAPSGKKIEKYIGKYLIITEHHRKIQNSNIKYIGVRQCLFRVPGQKQEHLQAQKMILGCWSVTFCGKPWAGFLSIRSQSHFPPCTWCDSCVWSSKTLQWSQPPAAPLGPALLPNFTSMAFQFDYKLLGFGLCLQSALWAFTDTCINCICLKETHYF